MSALSEFLAMGGYAAYVWGAYGVAVVVLGWNLCTPLVRRRQIERRIRRRLEQNQS